MKKFIILAISLGLAACAYKVPETVPARTMLKSKEKGQLQAIMVAINLAETAPELAKANASATPLPSPAPEATLESEELTEILSTPFATANKEQLQKTASTLNSNCTIKQESKQDEFELEKSKVDISGPNCPAIYKSRTDYVKIENEKDKKPTAKQKFEVATKTNYQITNSELQVGTNLLSLEKTQKETLLVKIIDDVMEGQRNYEIKIKAQLQNGSLVYVTRSIVVENNPSDKLNAKRIKTAEFVRSEGLEAHFEYSVLNDKINTIRLNGEIIETAEYEALMGNRPGDQVKSF